MYNFTLEKISLGDFRILSIGEKIIGDQAAFMLSGVVIDKTDKSYETSIKVEFTDKRPPFNSRIKTRTYDDFNLYNNVYRVSENVLCGKIPLDVLKEHIMGLKIADQDHELDIFEGIEAVIKNYDLSN